MSNVTPLLVREVYREEFLQLLKELYCQLNLVKSMAAINPELNQTAPAFGKLSLLMMHL